VFSISRFINLTDANNGKIIACVTFGTVWWGRGTNPNRRIKSDLVVACLVVIGSWVLVASQKPVRLIFFPHAGEYILRYPSAGGLSSYLGVVHHQQKLRAYKALRKVLMALVSILRLFSALHPAVPVEPRLCYNPSHNLVEVSFAHEEGRERRTRTETPFPRHDCVSIHA
jgi:hypothetical protein